MLVKGFAMLEEDGRRLGIWTMVLLGATILIFFRSLRWLIIPLAIIGAVVGMVSRGTAGRNLNLLVILIGVVRLMLGGGIL